MGVSLRSTLTLVFGVTIASGCGAGARTITAPPGRPVSSAPEIAGSAGPKESPAKPTGRRSDRAPEPARTAAESPKKKVAEEPPLELVLDESSHDRAEASHDRAEERAKPPERAELTSSSGKVSREPHVEATPAPEVRFRTRRGSRILVTAAPILFGRDRDDLPAAAKVTLDQVAVALARDLFLHRQRLEIVGYAETMERGPKELSERRARAARAYLGGKGLSVARLGLVAKGDADPLGSPVESRRVELRIAEDE